MINQKEGNGNIDMVLRIPNRSEFTSEYISSCDQLTSRKIAGWSMDAMCRWEKIHGTGGLGLTTYTKNSRVIWNPRRLWLRILFCLLISDADVLHVATPEDDVFVDIRGRGNLFCGVASTALGAKGLHILQCYR